MRYATVSLLLLVLASAAAAQTVSIGSVAGIDAGAAPGVTTIDMSHPATAAGSVTTAFVRWTGTGCAGSVKFKVVRLDVVAGVFNVVAERGPFSVVSGGNRLTLTPAVDVLAGDLVATVVLSATCGAVAATHERFGDFVLITNTDFASGKPLSGFNINRETRPLVQLTSEPSVLAGVIAAAGAQGGAFGSFFRTSMQLANPSNSASQGRIVFHPEGQPAQASDPSRPFNLPAFSTSTHPDIVTEMGLSAKGSIDIVVTKGAPPVVTARIFNDQGDAGTSGFYEDLIIPSDALHGGDSASFTLPGDPTNFRVNTGVRTLTATTLTVSYYDPAGAPLGGTNFKSYEASFYKQYSLSEIINGQPVIPGALVVVKVVTGDAIVYFSITDNRTNDTSATFLKPQS